MSDAKDAFSGAKWDAPVFALLMAVYWTTAAPGPWWGDGMELTCAATVLGISHPTGYPLYILLGHGLIRLFAFADPARVMTLFSAACCAGAAVLVGGAVRAWIARSRGFAAADAMSARLACLGLALLAGLSRTVWEHATYPEVYPLAFLISAAVVGAASATLRDSGDPAGSSGARGWILPAVLWGLAMLHHYSALAVLPLAALAAGTDGARFSLRRILLFAGVSSLFLLGYAWLPIRAAMNPALNWGDPSTLDRLLAHITGAEYSFVNSLRAQSGGSVLAGLLFWIAWWGRQLIPEANPGFQYIPSSASVVVGAAIIIVGSLGCIRMLRAARLFGFGLLFSIAMTLIFSVVYPIPDRDGYFLPAIPAMILGWLAVLQWGADRLAARGGMVRWNRVGAAAGLALAGALVLAHWRLVDKSDDRGPEMWVREVFDALPKDSLIITAPGNDAEIYALWHAQMVRGLRPDVTVFGGGFIFKGWYRKYFSHSGRPRLPLFITDRPPRDKHTYDVALAAGVVMPNLDSCPVFLTHPDSNPFLRLTRAPAPDTGGHGYMAYLGKGFGGAPATHYPFLIPSGLLFAAEMDSAQRAAAEREFRVIFGLSPPGAAEK